MLSVNSISFRGVTESSNAIPQNQKSANTNKDLIRCRYSQDDIKELLKEIGIDTKSYDIYPNFYTLSFDKKNNNVIIENESRTNDTVVIQKDGSVVHCGSWHNKEIAQKGSFTNIIDKVKLHVDKYNLN